MTGPPSRDDPSRTLALVLRPRYSGFAVMDRWGLVPRGFGCWNLHAMRPSERCAVAAARMRRMLERFRPSRVVVGVDGRDDPEHAAVAESALAAAVAHGAPVAAVPIARASALVAGRTRAPRRALPERLVRGFFPELARRLTRNPERERYWRPAFQAVAVALAAMIQTHPYSVAAMAHAEAFSGTDLAPALARSASVSDSA